MCGYTTRDPGEYHPYVFCILVKAGQDPWERAQELVNHLAPEKGMRWTARKHPPLVRDMDLGGAEAVIRDV